MRPKKLVLEGFASFRDREEVVFDDVDLFAVAGPTGAGKSSILDAIAFALYGSVARYENNNLIAPLICQGSNQARVQLDFSAGGKVYTAVRVVRRTKAGGATTAEARLECGEETIAGNEAELTRCIVDHTLGLTFDQFSKCVMLPQGEFARFLRGKDDRREILRRLLDARHFQVIMQAANRRASEATGHVSMARSRLDNELAGATPEALAAAEERLGALQELLTRCNAERQQFTELAQIEHTRRAAARQEREAAVRVRAVHIPDGIADLGERLSAVQQACSQAAQACEQAHHGQRTAEEALGSLPAKAGLVLLKADHERLTDLALRMADAQEALATASAQLATARDAEADSAQVHTAAVAACERARAERRAAETEVAKLPPRAELALLKASHERLLVVAARLAEAQEAHGEASAALAMARSAEAVAEARHAAAQAACDEARTERRAADAALGELRSKADLALLADRHLQLAAATKRLAEARRAGRAAADALKSAGTAEVAAMESHVDALAARDALLRADAAYSASQGLGAGDTCPVCGEILAGSPAASMPEGLEEAQATVDAAHVHLDDARRRTLERTGEHATCESALAEAIRTHDELAAALAGQSSAQDVASEIASVEAAEAALRAAREREHDAELDFEESDKEELAAARRHSIERSNRHASCENAIEQLSADRDLVAASLAGKRGADEVAAALIAHDSADAALQEARDHEREAEAALDELGDTHLAAARKRTVDRSNHAAGCLRALTEATAEHTRLAAMLDGKDGREEVAAKLQAIDAAEAAVAVARDDVQDAEAAVAAALKALEVVQDEERAAWPAYNKAHARIAAFGAPTADRVSLAGSWSALVTWAGRAATERDGAAVTADSEADDAERRRSLMVEAQGEACRERGINVEDGEPLVAAAQAEGNARRAVEELATRVNERERVQQDFKEAERRGRVAKSLAEALQVNNFERWYLSEALQRLALGASRRLGELSAGHYALALNKSGDDFEVVDHQNADERRSVRTLSGGETFLASLSLALALADEVAAMAAATAPRLEALFLDEGFGTLDPETLDTVADALDELRASGRMVGLVTHVAELASRMPVQYHVRKEAGTSRVERREA